MTSLLALQNPTYPQSFMLIYGFLFELWVLNLNKKKKMKNWGGPWSSLSQSTVLCFVIGMDKVFQHHSHTFEKFDLNFHFQCDFSSVCCRTVTMGNIHVYLKYDKNCITNNGDVTKS